ncbi:hypothetical protein [uncultured Thiodictyon sp.]|uniref:hypothetical protein n=1 Tax=uncultured Thiodictyon sp. TaxID=1846217 RepID=UPI0025D49FE7|nr:hypothetical protein [uncultured Thiodictyon sp.]
MSDNSLKQAPDDPQHYCARTPEYYLQTLDPVLRASFTEPQIAAVKQLLGASIPRPAAKLVDLRFWVDLLAYRFYVVLFVGKDRRGGDRTEFADPMARKGNAITALLLLIGLNFLISLFVLLIALSIKLAVGYSLLPHPH